jgi:hypothetical protein
MAAATSSPSPSATLTLLNLPIEIRLKILHYALSIPSRTSRVPNAISVFWPRAFFDPGKYKPPFYGTQAMSSLLTISRQLHSELEEILFTRFIFSFPHYIRVASVQDFVSTISVRARTLLREIMLGIPLDLGCEESEEFIDAHNKKKLALVEGALEYLKSELPGLQKVHFSLNLVSGPLSGILLPRRIKDFTDMVMPLALIFAPSIAVVITNSDTQQCRKDITSACQARLLNPVS